MADEEETQPTEEELRAAYLEYLQSFPGYQTILQQTQENYTPRGWIRTPVHLPRWTTEEFEAQRKKYQEKNGSRINPPQFDDIFQWNVPPTITTEEYAAHKYAQRRGDPSPLDDDQLKYLRYKRIQFLKMLQSPEPSWMKDIGEIITSIDAAEQALNSAYVIGRLALHAAPELLKGLVPVLGWVALGYDVMNLFDIYTQVGTAKYAKKRLTETIHNKNPFSEKAWARRAENLSKTWPSLGEFIQLAHTADHMFGVGLSLGATMAFINDAWWAGMVTIGETAGQIAATIAHPSQAEVIWNDSLKTAGALWASKDVWDIALPETLGALSNMAAKALAPQWLQNQPLIAYPGIDKKRWHYPKPKNPYTLDNMLEAGIPPSYDPHWPQTDEHELTIDEINDLYAAKIKDNFQTYCLRNQKTCEGYTLGQQVTEYNNTILQLFSDDHQAQIADVADVAAAKNMARAGLAIGPGSPEDAIEQLGDWIEEYEQETGGAPSAKEIKFYGIQIGINWATGTPTTPEPSVEKLFPGWQAIQDQIGKIFTPDQ